MELITTGEGVEMTVATDAELTEDAVGMMSRWTDYRIDSNDQWHTAMVAELERRGLLALSTELRQHRTDQEKEDWS